MALSYWAGELPLLLSRATAGISWGQCEPHVEFMGSMAAILNLEGEGSGHVIRISQNVPGEALGFKSHFQETDPGPSQCNSRTSPTPLMVCKWESEAARMIQSSAWNNRLPPI